MTTITKAYEFVQYNNYTELENVIRSGKLDLNLTNRRSEHIIVNSIKYRSKECFDLLVDSKYLNLNIPRENGLKIALEYYCNAPNSSNYYYLQRLNEKKVIYDLTSIYQIIKMNTSNEFTDIILNFIDNKQENINALINDFILRENCSMPIIKLIDIGLDLGLINNVITNNILRMTKDIEVLIKIDEIINNFTDKDTVFKCFYNNFYSEDNIRYLIDMIIKRNYLEETNFSKLLINYYENNSGYGTSYNSYSRMYNILVNFKTLEKLNVRFENLDSIIGKVINNCINLNVYCHYDKKFNDIHVLTKFIELLVDNNYINDQSKLFPNNLKISENLKNYRYNISISILKHVIRVLEKKNINLNEDVKKILTLKVSEEIVFENFFAKKIKPIK